MNLEYTIQLIKKQSHMRFLTQNNTNIFKTKLQEKCGFTVQSSLIVTVLNNNMRF